MATSRHMINDLLLRAFSTRRVKRLSTTAISNEAELACLEIQRRLPSFLTLGAATIPAVLQLNSIRGSEIKHAATFQTIRHLAIRPAFER